MSADDYRDCSPLLPYGDRYCDVGAARAAADARQILDEGSQRAAAMERDWARGDVISLRERAGVYVAKGGYFYALRHLWHRPRTDAVLESAAVWARPRVSYDALAHALGLNFTISLVEDTRTRPDRQDDPKCPKAKVRAMKRLVSECDLKMPYRCAWYSANVLLAELLNECWPIAWNDGVNASTCARFNFTAADLRARFSANASQVATAGAGGATASSHEYRRSDVAFAVKVHRRTAPAKALGSWSRADPTRDWLTTGHTSEHKACLNRERQGNCYENGGQGRAQGDASSRYAFIHRAGSDLRNSPGALAGRVDYAWRVNTGSAATEHLYREWSGPRTALVRGLERVLGTDGRVVVLGDSLSRQFAKTLECTLEYKLNMTHRVVHRDWGTGGKIGFLPRPSDVLVLNFGHWLDHGEGDPTHATQKSRWALAFEDLEEKKVAVDRVFVRTTQDTWASLLFQRMVDEL
ncbi:hypothetical protein JL721_9581 [Aureococcus anophagefferens]|nr:hypothetical protein JL721_9581 [Aureococcus anophagefferens]